MSIPNGGTLAYRSVNSLSDALTVRRLRNSCCDCLTNYQEPIGLWQQIRWYFGKYRPAYRQGEYRLYLFTAPAVGVVGYGALQRHEDELLATECVGSAYRGRGFGRFILSKLVEIARQERRRLVAEIWSDNERSIRLHSQAGFVLVSERRHKDRPLSVYAYPLQP